jgi:hypothetical protein
MLDLGRIDDALIRDLAERAARYPRSPFRAMLALAYATLDLRDEATAELTRLAPEDLASIPKDFMWAATLLTLSRVASRLGATAYARPLYDLLAPYAHRSLLWGSGFMIFGPVSRHLGMLATTLSEPELALPHLEDALRRCCDLGSPPLIVRTNVEIARALLMRGADGDGERAGPILEEARLTAIRLGMAKLAEEAAELASAAADGSVREASVG